MFTIFITITYIKNINTIASLLKGADPCADTSIPPLSKDETSA